MDYKEKATILRVCSSRKGERCSRCPAFGQGDRQCARNAMRDGATAINELLVENQALRNAANGFKDRAEKEEYRERQKCMRCRSKDPRELNSMKVLQYKFCPECGRDLRGGAV